LQDFLVASISDPYINRAKVIEYTAITRGALSELKKAHDIDPGSHKRLNDESSRQRESQAGLAHTGHTISSNPTILAQH
jgi:hypothetical protein